MSHVFHRSTAGEPPLAVRGEGIWLVDSAGRRYLDASGGAAVSCLGHSHPKVVAAIQQQVARLAYAHTGFFTNEPMEALADLLIEAAPSGLEKVFFVCDGSEATEAALKLARQHFIEIGQPQRRHLIARRQSYHGNTLGALAAGGNMARRAPFAPLLMDVTHVAPCYAYRGKRPDETEEAYGSRVADEIEAAIRAHEPGSVMAFIAETIVGATVGAVPPVPGYFRRVRKICDRHGVLLILDEVMCGMGRCGALYACLEEGVSPDILTIAKGLGGGYQPIGAMLLSGKIFESIRRGSGAFTHGHTYLGHATACAAALAVQTAIREEGLLENVRAQGQALRAALEERFGNHRHIGDIRGRGLLLALEFVADRASKAPFDPSLKLHARLKQAAMANGLICYPTGGTIDGRRGDHVIIAPPFIIQSADVNEIVIRLDRSIQSALAGLP